MTKYILRENKKLIYAIPGYGLSLGITVTMLSLLILIPLASILAYGFKLSIPEYINIITSENVKNAIFTSVGVAFIAAVINTFFGVILAWTIVRYQFSFRRIIDGLIELPFALPTAVAGITLSKMYSDNGFPGNILSKLGLKVSYTRLGILVALVFVGIPFVVRTVQPVLIKLDHSYEEAAQVLGAKDIRIFIRIILPELIPAILTGFGYAFARGIGEYGSVIYISGNSAKEKTQVVSYIIMQKLNYMDYSGASAVALTMLFFSLCIFLVINIVRIHQSRRTNCE